MSAPSITPVGAVLSLAQLLTDHPKPEPCLVEPGLLPSQGILFLGGEPKAGKSLLVANLALALAAGADHAGFHVPSPKRVLICQFELPTPQFALRLATMRKAIGNRADSNLFVVTRRVRFRPRSSLSILSTPLTTRMKTTRALWPRSARL